MQSRASTESIFLLQVLFISFISILQVIGHAAPDEMQQELVARKRPSSTDSAAMSAGAARAAAERIVLIMLDEGAATQKRIGACSQLRLVPDVLVSRQKIENSFDSTCCVICRSC